MDDLGALPIFIFILILVVLYWDMKKSDLSRQKRRGVPSACLGCKYLKTSSQHYSDNRYRITYWCPNTSCEKNSGFHADRPDYLYRDIKDRLNTRGIHNFDNGSSLEDTLSLAETMKNNGLQYNDNLSYKQNKELLIDSELRKYNFFYDKTKSEEDNKNTLHLVKSLTHMGLSYDKNQTYIYNLQKRDVAEKLNKLRLKYNESTSLEEMKHFLDGEEKKYKQKQMDRENWLRKFEEEKEEARRRSEEIELLKIKDEAQIKARWDGLFRT